MTVLGDVASIIDCEHRTAPRTEDEPYGFSIGTSAVRNGRIDLLQAKPVSKETFDSWVRRAVPSRGDLIFSREAPMGEVGAVPDHVPVCLGQRTVLVRLRGDDVTAEFVRYALMAPEPQQWIRDNSAGSTVLHVNVADVRRIPLPQIPPLHEQHRIVDLLEDHLSRLDAADVYLAASLARAKVWHSQVMGELLWSDDAPRVAVRDLLREPMRNGRSDRAVQGSAPGTRTLTLTAVTKNAFAPEHTKLTTTTAERAASLWLEPGDIFVQRSNTPELVGTSARYAGPRGWAIFPDLLIRLRPDESRIDGRFLTAALRSEQGHRQLRRKAKGAAGSMPKIDQAAIGNASVPVPPLEKQRQLLAQAEAAADALARLQADLGVGRARGRALRSALLSAAFSGRLTSSANLSEAMERIDA